MIVDCLPIAANARGRGALPLWCGARCSAHCVCGSARPLAACSRGPGGISHTSSARFISFPLGSGTGIGETGDRCRAPPPRDAHATESQSHAQHTPSLTHRTHTSERNDRASRSWTGPELLRSLGWYSRSFGLAAGGKVAHHVGGQHADWHEEPYPVDDHPKVHIKEVEGGQWGETLANAHGLHV